MTDNEIIKALECCVGKSDCLSCPCEKGVLIECRDDLQQYALDLINRQKAEIERLKTAYPKTIASIKKMYATAKAEAVKEFAERLKKEMGWWEEPDGYYTRFISPDAFDNLVKEMVGETNEQK